MKKIKVGTRVSFTTVGNGRRYTRMGKVIAEVPPYEEPDSFIPNGINSSNKLKYRDVLKEEVSFMILDTHGNLYRPPVSRLRMV